jgi:hypothetical protein
VQVNRASLGLFTTDETGCVVAVVADEIHCALFPVPVLPALDFGGLRFHAGIIPSCQQLFQNTSKLWWCLLDKARTFFNENLCA